MSYVSLSNIISKESDKQGRATVNYVDEQIKNTFNILNSAGKLGEGFNFNNGKIDVESSVNIVEKVARLKNTIAIYNNNLTNSNYDIPAIGYIGLNNFNYCWPYNRALGIYDSNGNLFRPNKNGSFICYNGFIYDGFPCILNESALTNLVYAFYNSSCMYGSLTKIPDTVINMRGCYSSCYNMVAIPIIGNKVEEASHTYEYCYNLIGEPVCPDSVINFTHCYFYCNKLIGNSVCGNNVINMSFAYCSCSNLTGFPACGPNVVNMRGAYSNCTNLTGQPQCGNNVIDFEQAYYNCFNLTGFPVLGDNVVYFSNAYYECNLGGIPGNVFIYCNNLDPNSGRYWMFGSSSPKNGILKIYCLPNMINIIANAPMRFCAMYNRKYNSSGNYYYWEDFPNIYFLPRTLEQMKQLDTANWYFNGVHK